MSQQNSKPNLMVIDDDREFSLLLERMLANDGFRVTTVNSGQDALSRLMNSADDIQLVLLDIRMPGIDGFETCRRIKSNPATADLPVMFMTAESRSDEMLAQALSVGGCDYLTKPLSRVDVLSRVRSVIQQRMELARLRDLEMDDKLTGLPHRNYFKARLDEELSESVRFQTPVSLVLGDIRMLQNVYEKHGNKVGDEWLERFALLLCSECRRPDVVARLSDYVFALLLPRVAPSSAEGAAERISSIWKLTTMTVEEGSLHLPADFVSLGHDGTPPPPSGGELLKRALEVLDNARSKMRRETDKPELIRASGYWHGDL